MYYCMMCLFNVYVFIQEKRKRNEREREREREREKERERVRESVCVLNNPSFFISFLSL